MLCLELVKGLNMGSLDGDEWMNAGDLQDRFFFSESFLHSEDNRPGRYYESMSLNLVC